MSSYPANSIGSTRALRLTTTLKANMTRLAAEALLGSLTSRGWLAKSKYVHLNGVSDRLTG